MPSAGYMIVQFVRGLANGQLFFFGGFVAVLFYVALTFVVPSEFGELRDRRIHYSLPIVFEISFLASTALCWLLQRLIRSSSVASSQNSELSECAGLESFVSIAVNLIPILVGCSATFLDINLGIRSAVVLILFFLFELLWKFVPRNLLHLSIQALGALLIVMVFLKSQVLTNVKDPHHWSYYLGPISGVLGGRTLLWDQPSQYGFLIILIPALISKLLGVSAINSLGLIVLVTHLLTTSILFYLFLTRVRLSPITAALSACATSLFIPGWLPNLAGSSAFPSVSGIRFLPALLAVWLVVLASQSKKVIVVLMAIMATAFALAWSFESFMYCMAPLVTYVFLTVFLPRSSSCSKKLPLLTLALSVSVLSVSVIVYALFQRLPIEPSAFYEYAMMYTGTFGTLPIKVDFYAVFYLFSLAYAYFVGRRGVTLESSRSFSGIVFFCYLWLLYSYYVARSHPNNVLNVVPWALAAIVLAAPSNLQLRLASSHRKSMAIVCALFLNYAIAAVNQQNFSSLRDRIESKELWTPPAYSLPPPRVMSLATERSNLTVLHDRDIPMSLDANKQSFNSSGLSPFSHFMVLPPARRCEYLRRIVQTEGAFWVAVEPAAYEGLMSVVNTCSKFIAAREIPQAAEWQVFEIAAPDCAASSKSS